MFHTSSHGFPTIPTILQATKFGAESLGLIRDSTSMWFDSLLRNDTTNTANSAQNFNNRYSIFRYGLLSLLIILHDCVFPSAVSWK
jgi:hypothetical protein